MHVNASILSHYVSTLLNYTFCVWKDRMWELPPAINGDQGRYLHNN